MSFMDLPAKAVVQREITTPGTPTQAALTATYVPQWKPSTAYAAGQAVVNASGDVVTAKATFTSGTTYNATNWNLSGSFYDKATADARFASTGAVAGVFRPAETRQRSDTQTIITSFQSGHGWTAGGNGTWNVNDTSLTFVGSQGVTGTSAGTGLTNYVQRAALASTLNLSNVEFVLRVRVTNLDNLGQIRIMLGDTSFTNNYDGILYDSTTANSTPYRVIREGEVYTFRFTKNEITNGVSAGTPNLATITAARLQFKDKNAGAGCTVSFLSFGYVPKSTTLPNGAVTLWFDDSYAAHRTIAAPALAKYGYAGSAALICDVIGTGGQYGTLAQMQELQTIYGWEVNPHAYALSAHTAGYPNLTQQQVLDDVQACKNFLTANGFGACDHFAYPLGQHSAMTDSVMARYFSTARTTSSAYLETLKPSMPLRTKTFGVSASSTLASLSAQVDRVYNAGAWGQFYVHNIAETGATGLTADAPIFRQFIDYLNTKGIPVLPAGDVWRAGL